MSVKLRILKYWEAPTPPNEAPMRLVMSEQQQLFWETFGDEGMVQLLRQMRGLYVDIRKQVGRKPTNQKLVEFALDMALHHRKKPAEK